MSELFNSEKYLDEVIRSEINKMINILYIECKDENEKFDKQLFLDFGFVLKEKASQHIQIMLDTYKTL